MGIELGPGRIFHDAVRIHAQPELLGHLDHPIGRVSRRLNSGISGISRSRGSPQSTRRSFAESRERQLTILADRGWRFGRSWAIPRRLIAGVLAANLSACAVASVSSPTETTMASVL